MKSLLHVCLLLVVTACGTNAPAPAIKLGMTKQEVRSLYGPPLRIQKHRGGGESWHYQMKVTKSNSTPFTTSSHTFDPYKRDPATSTYAAGVEWGDTSHEQPGTVDFNARGLVEALPNGTPVRQ